MKKQQIQMGNLRIAGMVKLPKEWLVDYQPARDRAIRWLGERYLFARDVPRISARRAAAAPSSSTSTRTGSAQLLRR